MMGLAENFNSGHELHGDGDEQQEQDAPGPHQHLAVDVGLAAAPEVVDPCGPYDREDGADGEHHLCEGVDHGLRG